VFRKDKQVSTFTTRTTFQTDIQHVGKRMDLLQTNSLITLSKREGGIIDRVRTFYFATCVNNDHHGTYELLHAISFIPALCYSQYTGYSFTSNHWDQRMPLSEGLVNFRSYFHTQRVAGW